MYSRYLESKIAKARIILIIALFLYMAAIDISIVIMPDDYGISGYEYVWFCSKILTIKKIINNNNNEIKIYNPVSTFYYSDNNYLDYLKLTSEKGCLDNLKKYGILDTYGNNFCFPSYYDCPFNDIIYDLNSKLSIYEQNGYDFAYTFSDLNIYYKYGGPNKDIAVKNIESDSQPKYINEDNFLLDIYAFNEFLGYINENNCDEDGENCV